MTLVPRRRTGFTLVELLVVITIIGVLIGLLVPVLWGAVNRANEARVSADINLMATALANFNSKYNRYPPSRVILSETGGYPPAPGTFYAGMPYSEPYSNIGGDPLILPPQNPLPYNLLADYTRLRDQSIQEMRAIFPKIELSTSVYPGNQTYDFNGNQSRDEALILLHGHECLTFFLGGIPIYDGSRITGMGGFSQNPRNPFVSSNAESGNRIPPLLEFDSDRLIDDDYDGIPGYVDTLGKQTSARYFAYFSAYGGAGYDPNDVMFNPQITGETNPFQTFSLSFVVNGNRGTTSYGPNPYTSSAPVPPNNRPATFLEAQSFQIISAGRDRRYGSGGQYAQQGENDRLPGTNRLSERDNITSFSNGTLD